MRAALQQQCKAFLDVPPLAHHGAPGSSAVRRRWLAQQSHVRSLHISLQVETRAGTCEAPLQGCQTILQRAYNWLEWLAGISAGVVPAKQLSAARCRA